MRIAIVTSLFVFLVGCGGGEYEPATVDDSSITGGAIVIDGDTIIIRDVHIRFHGIDAPESDQLCTRNGESYWCGKEATFALSDVIGRSTVTCVPRGKDRYKRTIAICTAHGIDLSSWMVQEGYAMAYRKYSSAYVYDETMARASSKGLWAGEFMPPWEWRKAKRQLN